MEHAWQADLEPLIQHEEVLAILLMGSISAGMEDWGSDIDLLVVYAGTERPSLSLGAEHQWDIQWETPEEFRRGHMGHWSAPAFLTAKVLISRLDDVDAVIREIVSIPMEHRRERTEGGLDAYLNAFYRSMKAARRSNWLGRSLHAGDAVRFFVDTLFCLNGWVGPYADRIPIALPMLEKTPAPAPDLLHHLMDAATGDPLAQSRLFRLAESFFQSHGYSAVYEAWGTDLVHELV